MSKNRRRAILMYVAHRTYVLSMIIFVKKTYMLDHVCIEQTCLIMSVENTRVLSCMFREHLCVSLYVYEYAL